MNNLNLVCNLEGGLLQASISTYQWTEKITGIENNFFQLLKRSNEELSAIPKEHNIWNRHVIHSIKDYKDREYNIYVVVNNMSESKVIPNDLFDFHYDIIEKEHLNNIKKDIYIADCFLDLPNLQTAKKAVVSGPWWFQLIVNIKRKGQEVYSIDTDSSFIVQFIKNQLNNMHYLMGIILSPLALVFRLLNCILTSVGHPAEVLFMAFLFLWPILLNLDAYNKDSFWCAMIITINYIIYMQTKLITGESKEEQNYVYRNYSMTIHLIFYLICNIGIFSIFFINKKASILLILMMLFRFIFSRGHIILLSTIFYPFLTNKMQIIDTITYAFKVFRI